MAAPTPAPAPPPCAPGGIRLNPGGLLPHGGTRHRATPGPLVIGGRGTTTTPALGPPSPTPTRIATHLHDGGGPQILEATAVNDEAWEQYEDKDGKDGDGER